MFPEALKHEQCKIAGIVNTDSVDMNSVNSQCHRTSLGLHVLQIWSQTFNTHQVAYKTYMNTVLLLVLSMVLRIIADFRKEVRNFKLAILWGKQKFNPAP
jgi:hypothetical protein